MRPINGNELPLRPELRAYGYAPGNYMGNCAVGSHTMYNVDKRAQCCLTCAEKLLAASKLQPVPAEPAALDQYVGGLLTAMKDTAIALTIEGVDIATGKVKTLRFVGADLRRESYDPSMLIGAGQELVFSNGAFTRAQ